MERGKALKAGRMSQRGRSAGGCREVKEKNSVNLQAPRERKKKRKRPWRDKHRGRPSQ